MKMLETMLKLGSRERMGKLSFQKLRKIGGGPENVYHQTINENGVVTGNSLTEKITE